MDLKIFNFLLQFLRFYLLKTDFSFNPNYVNVSYIAGNETQYGNVTFRFFKTSPSYKIAANYISANGKEIMSHTVNPCDDKWRDSKLWLTTNVFDNENLLILSRMPCPLEKVFFENFHKKNETRSILLFREKYHLASWQNRSDCRWWFHRSLQSLVFIQLKSSFVLNIKGKLATFLTNVIHYKIITLRNKIPCSQINKSYKIFIFLVNLSRFLTHDFFL